MHLAIGFLLLLPLGVFSTDQVTTPESEAKTNSQTLQPPTTQVTPTITPIVLKEPAKFNLVNSTGNVCAIGQFGGSIVYKGIDGLTNATLNINTKLDNKSSCNDKQITLHFKVEGRENLFLIMILNKEKDSYQLDELSSIYDVAVKNETSNSIELTYNKTSIFSVHADYSYSCLSQQTFQLPYVKNNTAINATLTLDNFKIDAFRTTNTTEYRTEAKCSLDNKPHDFVPIAVAIALVTLIVIVLISYLIGRKRSRRLAYESV